jgi:hypothetical protein
MNLEYVQDTRKVGAGSEKETMSRQVPAASPLFQAGGGIKIQYLQSGKAKGIWQVHRAFQFIFLISVISLAHQTTLPGSSPSAFAFRFTFSTGVSRPPSVSIS